MLHQTNAKISEIQKQFTKTDSPFAQLSKIVPPSSFIRVKPYPLIDKYIHSKLQTSVHIVKYNASFPIEPL